MTLVELRRRVLALDGTPKEWFRLLADSGWGESKLGGFVDAICGTDDCLFAMTQDDEQDIASGDEYVAGHDAGLVISELVGTEQDERQRDAAKRALADGRDIERVA